MKGEWLRPKQKSTLYPSAYPASTPHTAPPTGPVRLARPRQQITQHFRPVPASSRSPERLLRLLWWAPPAETPSRMSMLARVAASKTSSTPSILRAEHSL